MKKLLIIYKGWSSTNSLYKDIENIYTGSEIYYSDDPKLNILDITLYEKISVLAWSMGTLDAIEYEMTNRVDEMILISPTLDFTATTRPIIIKKMIKRLVGDKSGCLEDFTKLCFDSEEESQRYWGKYSKEILSLDDDVLVEGLNKLMTKKIEIDKRSLSPLIILGTNDKVISSVNSKKVVDVYPNAKVVEVEGGHNLFYSKSKELTELIKGYQKFT